MPTVHVPGVGDVDFPNSMSQADIVRAIEQDILPKVKPPAPPKTGVGAALMGGTMRALSSGQTALESILDPEGAAKRAAAREAKLAEEFAPATDLEKVKKAYAEKGLLPAAGEAIGQIPGAVAEQAPQIVSTLGGARLGAMAGAPFGPLGAIIGGVAGAAAPSLIQQFGSNIERQAEAGKPISRSAALAAAVPQAGLDVASSFIPLGRGLVGKILGPEAEKLLAKGGNKIVDEGLARTLLKGTAVGLGVEVPTEVTQQMLERLQAGLPLTTPDALAEYGQAAYGAGLVGGPFGALGRVGERSIARGKAAEGAAQERKLQEELATAEREQTATAEAERLKTPEYRQELNDKIWTLKDELAQIEPIAKDKAQDEDVRNEAIARAKEIKAELKTLNEQMKTSIKEAGLAPTLEQELAKQKAAAPAAKPIVDEFGRLVTPKKAAMTEEEYAAGYDKEAARMKERNELLRTLREKEEAEAKAKQEKTYEETQTGIKNYLQQLQDIEQTDIKETAKRVAEQQQRRSDEVAQEMTLDRIQRVLDNFGLRAAGVTPEVRKVVESKIDEGVVDRSVTKALGIEGLEGRTYRGEEARSVLPNILASINRLEGNRMKALTSKVELMDDKGALTPAGYKLVANEAKLNELKRLQGVIESVAPAETPVEGAVTGTLENVVGKPDEYLPIEKDLLGTQYNNRIKTANQRATGAFDDFLSYIDDLSKKRYFGGAPGQVGLASSTEENLRKNLDEAHTQIVDSLIEEVATARVARKLRPLSKSEAIGLAMDISSLLDMVATRSLAPAPGMVTTKEVTPAQMRGTQIIAGAEETEKDVRGISQLPFGTSAKKTALLTATKQKEIAENLKKLRAVERGAEQRVADLDRQLAELKEPTDSPRSQALAQSRTQAFEEVRAAQTAKEKYKQAIRDNLASSGITAKQAIQTIKNVIHSIKQDTIAEGQRAVRAGEKPLLKKQYAAPPTDLVKDLDRVLRMENLQSDVRDTLEAARRRMEEGGASEGLEELVDEQVGRILRGTDRPFTLRREVTEPGGKRAIGAAGKAELIDEIKTQMRHDSEMAQYVSTEQADLFPATLATARATPTQFQRLQKSGVVSKERAKIAAEKRAVTIKQAAEKVAAEKERQRRVQEAAVKKELTLAKRIDAQRQDMLDTLSEVVGEKRAAEKEWAESTQKQLDALIKEKKAFLRRITPSTPDAEIKKQMDAFKEKQTKLEADLANSSKQRADRLAVLDGRVQAEYKELKRLEKLAAAEGKKADKERLKKQAAAVEPIKTKTNEALEKLRADEKQREERLKKIMAEGLDLPGLRRYETVEVSKGVKRRKIVNIKTKAELAAERDERMKDMVRQARTTSPETMFEKLKRQEKEANIAFKAAKNKQALFVKEVNAGEKAKNFPKYKELSDEINRAKAQLQSIRENLRLLKDVEYIPEAEKPKQAARGLVSGDVKWYDKKFTPEQVRELSGYGVDAFKGGTYSVDDSIDFRIGAEAGGGIDQAQADARMADVKKKLPAHIKFEYFPTMDSVTVGVLKAMSKQGADLYADRVRGGVMPDGTVFVIGENHTDMTDLEKTIAHEFIGHYSINGLLGEGGMKLLLGKVDKSIGSVFKLAGELGVYNEAMENYAAAMKAGATEEQAQIKALGEVIAYTMEQRVDQKFMEKAQRWLKELVGAVRAWFRKMGMDLDMSTSDLFYLMKQAKDSFEEGKAIAYKDQAGEVAFRLGKTQYAPGLEDVGSLADKLIGRQKSVIDKVKANTMGLAGRVQFVDRFAALEALVNRGVSKGIIDSLKAQDVMYFARMSDQRHALVAETATNGSLKLKDIKRPDGTMEKIIESERGASLKDVSQALLGAGVGNAEATGRLFTLYLAAERAQRVGIGKLNFGAGLTEADLKKALDLGRNNKAFQKARELYNEYNKGLIDFAVQSGAISKEEGARLNRHGDYVPYYRMRGGNVELLIGSENPIRIGDIKSQPYLQELVGGKDAIMDFFTSSLQNTTLLTDMALRNLATRNAAFVLKDMGAAELHKGDGPASPEVIRFSIDGQKMWARLDTQAKQDLFGDIPADLVVKGMEGIKVTMPGIVRGMAMPANFLRKFVTRDPRYALRQIFRDSMSAVFTTGADMKPVVDTLGEMTKMYQKGYESVLQKRGVISGQIITGAPEDMKKILQQLVSGKPNWAMAMAKLDQFAMAGDAATRMAMYNSFLKQGLSEREATMAALESMNFGRRGVSPSSYFLNATIPFFNANVQGIDVLYRAFTNQMPYAEKLQVQRKLLMRAAMMAAFTLAYAAMMQDDDAYKNATPEQRYGNWFIRIPGFAEPFRVPMPFEIGLLFKALPEGVYNAAFGGEDGKKVAKALALQAMRSMPGNPAEAGVPVPTAIKPFIELALNKSLYTGRDIVDARLAGLEKAQQYTDRTPEMLKIIGPLTALIGFSPVQAEHFIRSFTGSLGVGLMGAITPSISTEAGPVEKRVSEMPIIGGLFQPNDAARFINDAYDTVKEVQAKQASYKKLLEDGRREEAQQYLKDNLTDIGMASFAGSFRQQMGALTKSERAIRAMPEAQMSAEKKREELDKLRKTKIQFAKQFSSVAEKIKHQSALQ